MTCRAGERLSRRAWVHFVNGGVTNRGAALVLVDEAGAEVDFR